MRCARRPIGRRGALALLAAIGPLLALLQSTSAEAAEAAAVHRLRAMTTRHPDDPDLSWALARTLAREGEAEAALRNTRRFVARWPEHRPEARTEIAGHLLEAGEPQAALALLDEEITHRPLAPMARFYRGLAYREEGRVFSANEEFRVAGRLAPELRAETLLARALGHFALGEDEAAVDLLRELLQLDPTGDTALRARLLLRQREQMPLRRSWRADGYIGFEWDDNVTLESAENEVPASDRDDFRGVFGLGGSWRAWTGDLGSLTLGYRHDQTKHDDLDDFDLFGDTVFASGIWRPGERVALRLDGIAWNTLRDWEKELTGGTLRPNLLVSLGPDWGLFRSFAQVEILEYHDSPLFEQWERDAMTYGVGLEHVLPLRPRGSWLSLSASFQRNLTQAGTNGTPDALDGDYDYDSWRGRFLGHFELPLELSLRLEASYSYDDYLNDNLTYFIESGGGLRKRTDDVLDGRIVVTRRIVDHVELELSWRGTHRSSNVDVFDYDKQVVGAVVRFTTE